jgi:hypothetical protein
VEVRKICQRTRTSVIVSRKGLEEIKDGIPGLVVRETLLNLRGIRVNMLGLGQVRGRESR